MRWWHDNKGKVIVTLIVLWIGALVTGYRTDRLVAPVIAVGASVGFDGAFSFIRKRQWIWTLASIVTGLLIGLISANIVVAVAASFIASIGKQFVGAGDHRHIFNPAVLGILVSSVVFGQPVAWWGASWGIVPVIIIAVGMTPTLLKLRRFWMPVLFLLVYFAATRSVVLTIDGTVFLFACIMLPEPTTSVGGGLWTYAWGLLVGGLVALQIAFPVLNVDPLLLALLGANLIGYTFLRI